MNSKTLKQTQVESPSLFLDLSRNLLMRIDKFIEENEVSVIEKKNLYKLFEEVYSTGYTNGMIE
jgi:hypothetical protein